MQVTERLEYAASPAEVERMFSDPNFLTGLVLAGRPLAHDVTVSGRHSEIMAEQGLPESAQKFTGKSIRFVARVDWTDAASQSRQAELDIHVPGQPVNIHGLAQVQPAGRGTVVEFEGAVAINMPIIGKKLEKETAPFVGKIFSTAQQQGDSWLAEH